MKHPERVEDYLGPLLQWSKIALRAKAKEGTKPQSAVNDCTVSDALSSASHFSWSGNTAG